MCHAHFGQHGLYVHVIKFHIPLSSISGHMYVATSSSLLVLHKDFLMAEFKFMQVKTTFDDKLNYLELINAALEQWPLLNCSLLFQQNETFSSRGS